MTLDDLRARLELLGGDYKLKDIGKGVYELVDGSVGIHNLLSVRGSNGAIKRYPIDCSYTQGFPEMGAIRIGVGNKEGLVDYELKDLVKPVYDKIYIAGRKFFELIDSSLVNLLDANMNQMIPITYNFVDIYFTKSGITYIICTKSDAISIYEHVKSEAYLVLSRRDRLVSKPKLLSDNYLGYYTNTESIGGPTFDIVVDLSTQLNVASRFLLKKDKSLKRKIIDTETNEHCIISQPAKLE